MNRLHLRRRAVLAASAALLLFLCACVTNTDPPAETDPPSAPPSSSPSAVPSAPVTDPPAPDVPTTDAPSGENTPLFLTPDGAAQPVAAHAEQGRLSSAPELDFSLTVPDDFSSESGGDSFRFSGGGASVEVGFVPQLSPEELAPSFMNGRIAFTDIEFSSFSGLGPDALRAELITAGDGVSSASAYLTAAGDGCAWLLLGCPADDGGMQALLNAVRDTFILEK